MLVLDDVAMTPRVRGTPESVGGSWGVPEREEARQISERNSDREREREIGFRRGVCSGGWVTRAFEG